MLFPLLLKSANIWLIWWTHIRCHCFWGVYTICIDWNWIVDNLVSPIIRVADLLDNKFSFFFLLLDLLYLVFKLIGSFSLLPLSLPLRVISVRWDLLPKLIKVIPLLLLTLLPSFLAFSLFLPQLQLLLYLEILEAVLPFQLITLNSKCFDMVSHLV